VTDFDNSNRREKRERKKERKREREKEREKERGEQGLNCKQCSILVVWWIMFEK